MKRPIFKSEIHNQEYLKNGYIKSQILNQAEVKSTLDAILKMRADDNFNPNREGASDYHCTFLDTNQTYKREANRLFKSIFNPKVEQLFHNYHVWNANLYVKPPGKGKFEIHQNWTHVKEEADTSFTIWCPLVDTTKENGTIHLVDGSHKILPDIATMNVPYYFHEFEEDLLKSYLKPIDRNAGEAVIFEDGVIHYSDVNHSDRPRYALQILIGPKEKAPVYYYYHKDRNQFEIFEIDDEFFMTNSYKTFHERPKNQKSLGLISNENKLIDLAEFEKALKLGDQRRSKVYE